MTNAITNLQAALHDVAARSPLSFPAVAETLRQAGVRTNSWWLPAMQSLYDTDLGPVLVPGTPLVDDMSDVRPFDRDALVDALRADQAGRTTFPEFAAAAWRAGVLHYVVDLENRTCTYYGLHDQTYVENYPAVPSDFAGPEELRPVPLSG